MSKKELIKKLDELLLELTNFNKLMDRTFKELEVSLTSKTLKVEKINLEIQNNSLIKR